MTGCRVEVDPERFGGRAEVPLAEVFARVETDLARLITAWYRPGRAARTRTTSRRFRQGTRRQKHAAARLRGDFRYRYGRQW